MKRYTPNRTQKLRSKPNRYFYNSKTLLQLSPNSRTKFMSLKNRANQRQRKKDNDNRNNILSRQLAFRELISSKNTTKKKSYVKKPLLHTIMESNSPALYTSNVSELSPNTRKIFLDHKQMSKKRSLINKTRGKPQTKSRHRNKGTKKRLKPKYRQ